MPKKATRARDCFVVETAPLGEIVRRFTTRWSIDRPSEGGRFSSGRRIESPTMTGLGWLVEETARMGSPVPLMAIDTIARGRTRTTGLGTADALVAAIGCPEAFYDGTLEVKPNPRAKKGCC